MPTLSDPLPDADEAYEALRGLAHATRVFDNPADTYPVLGDLLGGVRSLRQVLDQLAAAHTSALPRAFDDQGDHAAGSRDAQAAAEELHQAASLVDQVESGLDAAMAASGRIAWHTQPATETEPPRRWIGVASLQGAEADEALDLITHEGTDAAIERLSGLDHGEDTTRAALEDGYVYDTPPTSVLDRTAVRGQHLLVFNPFMERVSLLREHQTPPDPHLLDTDDPRATRRGAEHHPVRSAPGAAGADWFARPPHAQAPTRGLSL